MTYPSNEFESTLFDAFNGMPDGDSRECVAIILACVAKWVEGYDDVPLVISLREFAQLLTL